MLGQLGGWRPDQLRSCKAPSNRVRYFGQRWRCGRSGAGPVSGRNADERLLASCAWTAVLRAPVFPSEARYPLTVSSAAKEQLLRIVDQGYCYSQIPIGLAQERRSLSPRNGARLRPEYALGSTSGHLKENTGAYKPGSHGPHQAQP